MIELSQFVFEALRKDQEFILYRGQGKEVVSRVLVLSPARQRPLPETAKRLENEYALKEELDPAWATRPLAVAAHWGRTVLVLQDPGGVPLESAFGRLGVSTDRREGDGLNLALCLRVAINLAATIGALHERGIIHKDIKPANVLADPTSGQCWLTGFGIASRLPRERQTPAPPEFIAGTLPYMAPEQTGRMNRSIDSRSDLYALGVTLYEMLTGTLPFSASDPMEWVHCHIARQPRPPDQQSEAIPTAVSAIAMKLLAKTAEERYQTAAGVQADLQRCLGALEPAGTSSCSSGKPWSNRRVLRSLSEGGSSSDWTELAEVVPNIAPFPLGQHDTPDRLRIPEKLYGRDREIDILLAAFDRVVAGGRPELVLVSGYSGIGKSSVVNELHKVLVPPRGLFASGKFDQYKRNIPYWTLAQAFQSLVRPLLAKSEAELSKWREALQEALGPNGRLIVDLVPELELITGQQPAVADLPPQDAKARFQLVFRRFVSVFARAEHPLALFIDDLQWLDAATLEFLEDLLSQPDVHYLMLIGAYRDNEIDSTHPLRRKLDAIRQAGAQINETVLAPLNRQDLGRLLVETLRGAPERIAPLAHLVHAKTVGNPFFAIQFINALAEESFLSFDHTAGRWSWDLNRIQAKGYTDNVAELMVAKLNRLASGTQKALQEFACLGNSAAIPTLSIVRGISEEALALDLWQAERLQFIVRSEGFYRFTHDRVQEAAYSLIPASAQAEAHLRIGRLLKAHTVPQRLDEAVFEIVSQFNRGAELITSREEREEVAQLNLLAGKRAKASTAYTSALNYLIAGAKMLTQDSWERHHRLTFELELHRAECEFLTGRLSAAEERLTVLSSRAADAAELATVTCLRIDLYTTLDRSERAVAICLEYLRHLGVEWSPHPTAEEARREYERIWTKIASRTIEDLIDLPVMSDPTSLGTLDVLTKVLPAAAFTDVNLNALFVCRMVNLSLDYGISDGSSFAFACLAMIAAPSFGNYKDGFRFGRLGYELVEKRGLKRFRAGTYMVFGAFVMPWTKNFRVGRDLIQRAFEIANQIGDLCFAAFSCVNLNTNLLAAGSPLAEVQREAENGYDFARKVRFGAVIDHIASHLGFIRTLRGLTPTFGSFDDGRFDEIRFERNLANSIAAQPGCFYWILKLQARFLAGEYAAAIGASLQARRLLWTASSLFETAEYHFYTALARAAAFNSFSTAAAKEEHLQALVEHHKQLALWAENCPENFENRAALVAAEIARIEVRELDAEHLYEQAIRSSHANGFVHNEALASEQAARFYRARGFDLTAQAYLRKSRAGYLAWGAIGKVRQLDESYPQLREAEPIPSFTNTIGAPVDQLDLATVIKALQTLSGEIVFEKLIDTLMRMVIEHAAAQRGLLILAQGEDQRIEAEATTNGDTITVDVRAVPVTTTAVPESIVRYVTRTKENVILDDASTENRFSEEDYLRRRHSKSVLCLPLVRQATFTGLLYLENSLAPRVFTSNRLAVLELLASQAAISLDNARLYADLARLNVELTQENSDRRRAEEALRASEQQLQDIIDNTSAIIFVKDLELRYLLVNREFERRHKLQRHEIRGKDDFDILPHEVAEGVRANDVQVIEAGVPIQFEEIVPTEQGNRCNICSKFLLHDRRGRPYAVCGIATDITERRRAEDALRQAQTEIARVSRMTSMEQLAASIAHEVNQPLAAVVISGNACSNWLAASPPNLLRAREAVERIVRDGNRASDVLKRVRALLRKAPLVTSPVNVNEVIKEVVALVGDELRKQTVELSTELDLNLPTVTADFVQLQQVLLNLVMNAIESMATTTGRPRILNIQSHLEDHTGRSAVVVAVCDSGVGLTPEETVQVFEAFYSTKPEGMGMGLWICRSIIEVHGGQLTARPNDAGGATFQFVLPSSTKDRA